MRAQELFDEAELCRRLARATDSPRTHAELEARARALEERARKLTANETLDVARPARHSAPR